MQSIREKQLTHPLPDIRNFGVALRVLLGVNFVVAFAALIRTENWEAWWPTYVNMVLWAGPILFLHLAAYALIQKLLWRLPPLRAQILLLLGVSGSALAIHRGTAWLLSSAESWGETLRFTLFLSGTALLLVGYFAYRSQHLSPSLAESRLQALNARIRPHFLFNSMNTILALIRRDPQRAEIALEELSELYRHLLQDPQERVCLSAEIALCRQYIDVEKLRLGERLSVNWNIHDIPDELLVPPLLLQPLLENAVYHGIEPLPEGGSVSLSLQKNGDYLNIEILNPLPPVPHHGGEAMGSGQHMAIANIRERLSLFYDLEASIRHGVRRVRESPTQAPARMYSVKVSLPWQMRA